MANLETIKKSILIVDTPESCNECVCITGIFDNRCGAVDKEDVVMHLYKDRPEWCPLRDVVIKPKVENINER